MKGLQLRKEHSSFVCDLNYRLAFEFHGLLVY
jgi:hypothetical protein